MNNMHHPERQGKFRAADIRAADLSKLLRNVLRLDSIEMSSRGFTVQNVATGFFDLHGDRQG